MKIVYELCRLYFDYKNFHPIYSAAFNNIVTVCRKMSLGTPIAVESETAKCVLIEILKKFGLGAQNSCC